jgi:DNA-binding GntR family transcriptional regulator
MIAGKIARTYAISMLLGRAQTSHHEHLEILEYLKNGDTEKAIAANIEHLRTSKEGLLHLIEKKKNLLYID